MYLKANAEVRSLGSDITATIIGCVRPASLIFFLALIFGLILPSAYAKTTPTLTVATSGTPSTYGSSVTFTATISSGPTGTITFYDGGTSIGTGTISSGKATYSTSSLAVGSHSITASWPGNTNYYAVTSSAITQTVNKATPTLSVSTSGSPSTFGNSVTFTATISSGPTGTVTFYDSGNSIGTGTISGGRATYSTSGLTAGSHTITAGWPGNSNYNSVTSSSITQTVNKATPTITWPTPSPITYGAALSGTQLNASTSVAGTFAYSPTSGTVLTAGSQTLSTTFTPTDTTDYNSATAHVTLTVNKATPTITWATPSPITYGAALSGTQLNASTTVGGTFAYSPASGTVLTAGSQTLSATFTPTDTTDYNSASAHVTLTVNKATPTITWPAPAAIVYGSALSAAQLDATANTPGTFSYTPALGTVLAPGAQTLSTTFVPTDSTDYVQGSATTTLQVLARPSAGIITTVAGNGFWGYAGDSGAAIAANLAKPGGIALDAAGNLYIADTFNNVIREVLVSNGTITTVAGNGTAGYSGDGQLATVAELNAPWGIALDRTGNIFIADTNNSVIRRVDAISHTIATVAGMANPIPGYAGDGGPAINATLNAPTSIAFDSAGNYYIADTNNNVIREVSVATGYISTVAGNGTAGYLGDGQQARSAELNGPVGIAIDQAGNIFIADAYNNAIREVNGTSGTINTVAGNGTAGYSGDGGSPTSAELNFPLGVAVDSAGNILISDSNNNRLRKVSASSPKTISTIAGDGTANYSGDGGLASGAEFSMPVGLALDSAGNIYIADFQNCAVRAIGLGMAATTTSTPIITWNAPSSIAYRTALSATQLNASASVPGTFIYLPASGSTLSAGLQSLSVLFTPNDTVHYNDALWTVPLTVTQATPVITWAAPAPIVYGTALSLTQLNATANTPGDFTYTPGSGSIPSPGVQTLAATFTPFDTIDYTTAVATEDLTVSTTPGSRIITTIAGNSFAGNGGINGTPTSAELNNPTGVAIDGAGNVYIADQKNNQIKKVSADRSTISLVAGNGAKGYAGDNQSALNAELNTPGKVIVDSAGNLYIADSGNSRVRKVTVSTGTITTIAGNGTAGFSGDGGPAQSAELNGPWGLAFDASGNLYIADRYNARIRKVDGSGTITTIAGNGVTGYGGDNGPASSAEFNVPTSLAFDAAGNLFIYDTFNNRVRRLAASNGTISSSGIITTVAGNGTAGYTGDNGPATNAELSLDGGLAIDSLGNIYIADSTNNVVRMVDPSGTISTVAGNGVAGYSGDGGPATSAELHQPEDVAVDSLGNFYIADFQNDVIREVGSNSSSAISVTVSPTAVTLYAGQPYTFHATVNNSSNQNVNWTLSSVGGNPGTMSGNIYTAPAIVSSQQTVTVTATSQADPTKSAYAVVTLMPTISVSINPQEITLYANGQQTFTPAVTNTTNTAVTWSMTPSGPESEYGSLSNGSYTAPASISTPTQVKITATSQADPTKSAFAIVFLQPPCVSNGYGFARTIVIDHHLVPNTDQINFPVLFNSTDPSAFASVAHGGHVASSNGYDIIFTSDPDGQSPLNYELEEYDPVKGTIVAWIQIPRLSHTQDTTIYLFYGNNSVSTSQQHSNAVWDSNYVGVWHLPNGTTLSANDSTSNGHNGSNNGATAIAGEVDGAASFSGGSSYIDVGNLGNFPNQGTIEFWMNPASLTNSPNALTTSYNGGNNNAIRFAESSNGALTVGVGGSQHSFFNLVNSGLTAGKWYHIVLTWNAPNETAIGYMNGIQEVNWTNVGAWWPTSVQDFAIGTGYDQNSGWNGGIDEVRYSNAARSSDWIAVEYANQSSPSTFYSLGAESDVVVSPASIGLYASQQVQFKAAVLSAGTCSSSVQWSMLPDAGILTQDGQYTAPDKISAPQTVVITATNPADSSQFGTAIVSLLPKLENPTLVLSPTYPSPYVVQATEQFTATLKDEFGSALANEPVTLTVTGANSTSINATTNIFGVATFTYTGANSGADTLQASTTLGSVLINSNSVNVNWYVPTQSITTSPIEGQFFLVPASNIHTFTTPPGTTPAFVQYFPDLIFNPNRGSIPGVPDWVNDSAAPFTNITLDVKGNPTGTIFAQGNGYQAGCGPDTTSSAACTGNRNNTSMEQFQAVFTGTFNVSGPTTIDFDGFVDDSFFLGIGNGATRVSGPTDSMPATTPFLGLPALGALAVNDLHPTQIVVNFPAAGSYPYEIDYSECCGFPLDFVLSQGPINGSGLGQPIPPNTGLILSPGVVQPLPIGGTETFTVSATDAAGNPVPNLPVSLAISGSDTTQVQRTTGSDGTASIPYTGVNEGIASVQATAVIDGTATYSNVVSVPWTSSPVSTGGTLSVSANAANSVSLSSSLSLSGAVSDPSLPQGSAITTVWSTVSGPGTVTFGNTGQISTTATFSAAGVYVLKLAASDTNGSASANLTVSVFPSTEPLQGWIASPAYGAQVSGIVPITLAAGVSLQSGTLQYFPANNQPAAVTVPLSFPASGTIAKLDTTQLSNGTYWITLQATDSNGNSEYNLALVTVAGDFKPGRVTTTVTDLVVPADGLAIQIQRTYDSLNANTIGDFGYGWNLGTNVNLTVDPKGDVTFTLGGVRKTFYFEPQPDGFLPFFAPYYIAEPGFHGTLAFAGGCTDFFHELVPDGNLWECVGGGLFTPQGYVYTDPSGTSYTMTATGTLQSIADKNGNTLTISPAGITSSTGLSVTFIRDQTTGVITSITDTMNNVYHYGYDSNGNLTSVTYPANGNSQICAGAAAPNTSQYLYYPDSQHPGYPAHYFAGGTDANCNALPSTTYFGPNDLDQHSNPLNGKLASVTDALGETTSYTYDLTADKTTITYPLDSNSVQGIATLVYDNLGDLIQSTDPNSLITTNTYDANRNLTKVTDPAGYTTCYTYDTNGNRLSTSYPQAGSSCSPITNSTAYNSYSEPMQSSDENNNTRYFNYDVNFSPVSVTDNLGTLASFQFNTDGTMAAGAVGYDITVDPTLASKFVYDTNGNLQCRTNALGHTTSYSYDNLGHKTGSTIPQSDTNSCLPEGTYNGGSTQFSYDQLGNLLQTTAPLGRITSSAYDGLGNKTQDTDADGHITKYQYDALNRLSLTTYAVGKPESTTDQKFYDFRGNVTKEIDRSGNTTIYSYDPGGRLSLKTQAFGMPSQTETRYEYDGDGRRTQMTVGYGGANPIVSNYQYDAAGDLTGVSTGGNSVSCPTPSAGTTCYTYDYARNRISMTDGKGNTTRYAYDSRKRLKVTTYPDGTTVTNSYDGPGNLKSVVQRSADGSQSNEIDYAYDPANELHTVTQVSSPDPQNQTIVGYDINGNPVVLTDANTHTTNSSFDLLGELQFKTLPDHLQEKRDYDTQGNLIAITHFNGYITQYNYNALNQLTDRIPDPRTSETAVHFTYTGTGKRLSMTDVTGLTSYTYDNMDRLTQKATQHGTLNYTYDSAGHVASMQSGDTKVNVSYEYDSLGRLSKVVDGNLTGTPSQTTTYTYDNANNVYTVAYPNGVSASYLYDPMNRVIGIGYSNQSRGYSYAEDYTGKKTSVSEPSGRQINWSFDGINRLTEEQIQDQNGPQGAIQYFLDPVGNRNSDTSGVQGIQSQNNGTFGPDDHLPGESYDNDGNVTITGGKTYAYDSQDELVSMGSVTLRYDGDGTRIIKSTTAATTTYLIDDLSPTGYPQVVEEITNGNVSRTYTYGLQRISVSQYLPANNNAWTPSFYVYDGTGNVVALDGVSGNQTDTYKYDAFGNLLTPMGPTPNEMLYRGEQWDSDLGLYYLRARFYNPLTGRFMGRDPENGDLTDPATLHKYNYAGGDPINLADPTGRQTREGTAGGPAGEWIGLAGAALSVTVGFTTHPGSVQAFGQEMLCALNDLGSVELATVQWGIDKGQGYDAWIERTDECHVRERKRKKKRCPEEHPDWPVQYVHFSTTPTIAAHISGAQAAGWPDGLTYLGPNNPMQKTNRNAACPGGKYQGMSCDEYPYASTAQGGLGASTAPVPIQEQYVQGGELGGFYGTIAPGENFCVKVVP